MLTFVILLTLSQILAAYLLFRREVRKNSSQEHNSDLLTLRLKALQRETGLIQEDLRATRLLRHDLRHHYRMLYALLGEGEKAAALEHIRQQRENILQGEREA